MQLLTYKKTVSNELKEFLIDNKMQDIYNHLVNTTDSKNYFDLSITDKSKISYLKGDRIPENTELLFDHDYRESKGYHTKIGKLLSTYVNQLNIQKISAIMSNRLMNSENIRITDNICKYYHEKNYANSSGQLGSSCMKNESNQNSIKLYETFGKDIVRLLIYTDDNNKVLARSLFWQKVNKDGSIIQYLDRVYAINDNVSQLLYSYAESRDILHFKQCQGNLNIDIVINDDESTPYFDTFTNYEYNKLSNRYGKIELSSVTGQSITELSENYCICDNCGDNFDSEDIGGYCETDDCSYCDNCGTYIDDGQFCGFYLDDQVISINGDMYHKDNDNIVFSNFDDEYYHVDDCYYSEYHNDYIHCDDMISCKNDDDDYYHKSDIDDIIVKIDNDYYLKDDDNVIKFKDYENDDIEYALCDSLMIEIDGIYYWNDDTRLSIANDKYYLKDDKKDENKDILPHIAIVLNKECKNIIVKCKYFKYMKNDYVMTLFVHKNLLDSKMYTVSEKITGLKIGFEKCDTIQKTKQIAMARLDSIKLSDIKNAILKESRKDKVLS